MVEQPGVRIPRGLVEEVGLGAGTEVSTIAKDGELVLRPSLPTRLRLSDLLAGITPENIHASIDTGAAVGTEALGSEQRGRRPALGLSPKTYNGKVGLALFCPIPAREQERQPWIGFQMAGLGYPRRRRMNRRATEER